jgi:hypothetical protein
VGSRTYGRRRERGLSWRVCEGCEGIEVYRRVKGDRYGEIVRERGAGERCRMVLR